MRIDPNAKTADLPETRSTSRSAAARTQPHGEVGSDTATLAAQTRVHQLQQVLQSTPDSRQEKVEALRRAVRDGQYDPAPEKIAQSLFMEMSARAVLNR